MTLKFVAVNQEVFGVIWNKALPSNRNLSTGLPSVYEPSINVVITPKPDVELTLVVEEINSFREIVEAIKKEL